jgi:hypothetical protein
MIKIEHNKHLRRKRVYNLLKLSAKLPRSF